MNRTMHTLAALLSLALTLASAAHPASAQTGGMCSGPLGASSLSRVDFVMPNGARAAAVGDFNGDGRPDIALATGATNAAQGVALALGTGNGRIGTPTFFGAGTNTQAVAVGDFNGDGKPDLVAVNTGSNSVSVLLGDGSGGFAAAANFNVGAAPSFVAVADFNADNKRDLAVTNAGSNSVSVLLGDGAGGFAAANNLSVGTSPRSVAAADSNGDGKPDLVVANETSNNLSILLNNGSGGFGAATSLTAGVSPRAVVAADFNKDGKIDLAVANHNAAATVSEVNVLTGQGDGSFDAPRTVSLSFSSFANNLVSLAVGDITLEGNPDLVVGSVSGGIMILKGDGSGNFSTAGGLYPSFATPNSVAVADLNGDSRDDVAVANSPIGVAPSVSVFLNTCNAPKIEVSPTFLTFGDVTVGQTKDLTLTVRNTGGSPLTVSSITGNNAAFSAPAPAVPFNVAAGGQQSVTVRFAPTAVGNTSGAMLTVNSNDPANPATTVPVSGTGLDPCASVISPTSQSFAALGGTGSVTVTIATGCAWTAASNAAWLAVTSGASGSGNGAVNYSVAANLTNSSRTGTLIVAGKTFTVTQAGCSFTLAPSVQAFITGGGTGSVNVSTVSGCAWTATSNAPWLTVTGGASGSGDGVVNYSVAADAANNSRIGNLTIAGQTFTVLQGAQAAGWVRVQSGTTNDLRGVHFLNESEGWVAGLNTTLLKTSNGGLAWTPVTNTGTPAAAGFLVVRVLDQSTVWIGGSHMAGRTTNGGATWHGSFWNPGVFPTHSSLFPLTFDEALAVGPGVPTSHVFLAGFTLIVTHTSSPSGLSDIHAVNADDAWAVGDAGRIYRIADADGAANFNLQPSGTTQPLNAVFFLDANTGWVVGNGGTILKTTNGGAAWTPQPSGTTANLRDVHFVDAGRGWAVGDGGVILTTANGGGSWAAEASGVTTDLRGVHFVNAGVGYAVGSGGVILRRLQPPTAASVSGASYAGGGVAANSIVSAFGLDLATGSVGAPDVPLPTTLAGTTVRVKDSAGDTRDAPLFYVSPRQINYLIPPDSKNGAATVTVTSGNGNFAVGTIEVLTVAPGLFAANADGRGVAAALVQRIKADGTRVYEEIVVRDAATNRFVAKPIDLGPDAEQVFLELYGTGIRRRTAQTAVQVTVGGAPMEVLYADAAPVYVGLDQVNIRLARTLIGRGEVDLVLTVDGKTANTVRISIK